MGIGGGETGGAFEVAATDEEAFLNLFRARFQDGPVSKLAKRATKNYAGLRNLVLADEVNVDRSDMPVIDRRHVAMLYRNLARGRIDITPPYSGHLTRLLPPGAGRLIPTAKEIAASKELANAWQHSGDGARDRVEAFYSEHRARKLVPIQRQIYLDKVFDKIAVVADAHPRRPLEHLERHFRNTTLIVSGDRQIIDGDHRWATMMLLDPKYRLNCLVVDLPLDELLQVSRLFTAAIGNKANA